MSTGRNFSDFRSEPLQYQFSVAMMLAVVNTPEET
jgi:hypothetical protein